MKKSEYEQATVKLAELALKADHENLSAKELGDLLDMHAKFKEARLKIDKESDLLKKVESGAEQLVIRQLRAQEVGAAGGVTITARLAPVKYVPQVADWSKLQAYIAETKDFSLLQKRMSDAAVRERWEDGVILPGVEKFPVYSLSYSRIK